MRSCLCSSGRPTAPRRSVLLLLVRPEQPVQLGAAHQVACRILQPTPSEVLRRPDRVFTRLRALAGNTTRLAALAGSYLRTRGSRWFVGLDLQLEQQEEQSGALVQFAPERLYYCCFRSHQEQRHQQNLGLSRNRTTTSAARCCSRVGSKLTRLEQST